MMTNPLMSNDSDTDSDDSAGLEIFADLKVALNSNTAELRKRNSHEQHRLEALSRPHPLAFSIQLDGNGRGYYTIQPGPRPGREWLVRYLQAVHSTYQGELPTGASAQGAAGAAASVTLNGPVLITGFDVTIGPGSVAGLATVTLSGVPGGPYTYYIEESTTASEVLTKSLNLPATGNVTLSVNAVATGGVVSLNLYGTQDISPADVTFYRGQNVNVGNANLPLPQNMVFHRFHCLPGEEKYTADTHRIVQNQMIIVGCMNGIPNGIVLGTVVILDQPAFSGNRPQVN
jgi:hypothetical protein